MAGGPAQRVTIFRDLYIAYQLAKLLIGAPGERDQLSEVLWEKKAADLGAAKGVESVYVDDCIIRLTSGRCVYVQVKETAPIGGWSAAHFTRSGAAAQFWSQWCSKPPDERLAMVLRFASAGDVSTLALVVDVARRSRTPGELLSDEAAEDTASDARTIAANLSIPADSVDFLTFLKSLHFEQLRSANELYDQTVRSMNPFGTHAVDVTNRMIRLVAMSKHVGQSACSSFTRDGLLRAGFARRGNCCGAPSGSWVSATMEESVAGFLGTL